MTVSTYDRDDFSVLHVTTMVPMWILGSIVDLETTGLRPDKDKLTGLGYVTENRVSVHVLVDLDDEPAFRRWAISKVKRLSRPLIAYYKPFEEKWTDVGFDVELQPSQMRKKSKQIFIKHLHHDTTGNDIKVAMPDEVAFHLFNDLLEELALYASLSHEYRAYRFSPRKLKQTLEAEYLRRIKDF